MGDEDDGGSEFILTVFDKVQDLLLDGDVEGRCRLISDEHFGTSDESHSDHDSLSHSAGKLVRVGVDALVGIGDADFFQRGDGEVESFLSLDPFMDFQRFGQLLGNF